MPQSTGQSAVGDSSRNRANTDSSRENTVAAKMPRKKSWDPNAHGPQQGSHSQLKLLTVDVDRTAASATFVGQVAAGQSARSAASSEIQLAMTPMGVDSRQLGSVGSVKSTPLLVQGTGDEV